MTLLNRYLYGQTVRGLLLAFAIIISLVVLVDYVEISRRIGSYDQVSSLTILRLTLLKMPGVVEQTLPFIVLFGVMWSMFRLNRRSELVALRAAGYSAWKFTIPPAIIAVLLGVFSATVINPGATWLNAQFEAERISISRSVGASVGSSKENIWLREAVSSGYAIIHAKDSNPQNAELLDVIMFYYKLDENQVPVFVKRIDAKKAQLRDGFWELSDASENIRHALPVPHENYRVETSLNPNSMLEYLADASSMSFWDFPQMIERTRAAQLDTRRYELQWQRLLALPLTLAAMAIIGAAFSFRMVRLGGVFGMVITGGSIGFLLYFAGDLLEALGTTGVLPPVVAIWSAPAFIFFSALARITIVEDG
ncbi:Lipopolysaccharide export system permease protein LptG [hydrothermal vent metagenome]|uniref:Lipopolysaccharide export system permease protein LptG n=1 Tax=hydrothermal vent metagenome TaxID=652676 RepID=A0A3B0RP61_9ZZZZ